jgi:hypothetical protein
MQHRRDSRGLNGYQITADPINDRLKDDEALEIVYRLVEDQATETAQILFGFYRHLSWYLHFSSYLTIKPLLNVLGQKYNYYAFAN